MKNVLKMMKPPTSRAITANTNMKVLKKLRPCLISSWLSWVISAPVTASVPVGSSGAMRCDDLGLRDPVVGDDQDAVELVRLGDQPLRSVQGEQHERRATGGVGITELRDAGDGDVLWPALHEHLRGVTDAVTRVVRALLVDDHLVVGTRRVAIRDFGSRSAPRSRSSFRPSVGGPFSGSPTASPSLSTSCA